MFTGRAAAGMAGAAVPDDPVESLRRDSVYRRALGIADMASALVSVVFAIAILGEDTLKLTFVVCLPVLILANKAIGLYDRDEHLVRKTTLEEVPALFQVATVCTLVIWLAEGLFVDGHLGRHQVLGLWGLLSLGMIVGRALARWLVKRSSPPERCLVIGDGPASERVRCKLEQSPSVRAVVVGRVPLDIRDDPSRGVPPLGELDSLALALADHDIERAIIAPGSWYSRESMDVVRLANAMGVKVSVLPTLFETVGSSVEFDDVEGMMLLGVRRYGLTASSRLLKRSVDLVGACLLLPLLSPLIAWIAVAIKLGSSGPVLFRQKRVGINGSTFELLKFRTMHEGADRYKPELHAMNEADGLFKIADDPRVTKVGRLLRRASLDELPQLINVLRGEMSLVGPRPLIPEEDRQIRGFDRRRLHVKPGITGVWQIFGSARIPLHEMVKIDYLYGANWSLWLDLKILFRTIPYALARRGM